MNSIWLNAVRASGGLDPDAAAIIAAMTVPPDAARQSLINDTVLSLKASGVWALLDCLWVMAAHDSQAGRLNWKDPASFTLTTNGTITFTTDRGWEGDGATGYLDTGWIPATHGVNYTLNDASFGAYCRLNASANTNVIGSRGASNSGESRISPRNASGLFVHQNNGNGASFAIPSSFGLSVSRRQSGFLSGIKNGSLVDNVANASSALSPAPFFLSAINDNGVAISFSTNQLSLAFTAAAMTEAHQLALYNTFQSGYLASVGAAV